MEVTLAVLADYSNVSAEGKLNVLGIFDAIYASTFPVTHPMMHLVMSFEFHLAEESIEKPLEIQLRDEDGKKLLGLSGTITPKGGRPGEPTKTNHVVAVNNIKFDKPGTYQFSILVGGEVKRDVSLRVLQSPKNQ